jgi:hypothetical protein
MFRYLIDCLQYKRELTLHRTLTSLHSTSCHFTSLPPCISPASNDLRTGIIISYCDAKITCKRHLFAPHHHDVQPPRHSIPLSLPLPQPTHFHPPPISSQISLTATAKAPSASPSPTSLSLDSAPLSRTADGYQPLQLPPHRAYLDRPGCARCLLLPPPLHVPIRWQEGTRGERAPS